MINDEIIESFVNCKYKAYRKLNSEHGIKTEFELLQEEQLSMGKTEFYKRLSEKYGENNLLKGYNFGKNRRVPRMDVIIQPTLRTETYQISFDAIEINPDEKPNSKKIKIPILISPKEKISKIEKVFIAIKCVILSKTCGVEYEFGKIIYGSDLKTVKFKIEPFITEAKKTLNELHKISKGEFQPLIFHKNHCKTCEFQEACKMELLEKDDLGLLRRMREDDIKRYNSRGIFTVHQLSYTFRRRKISKRIKTRKHPFYFSLQALAIKEQKVYLYNMVDMPNTKTKVFIDMEGDSSGSFIYLIGILVIENGEIEKYSLWANDFDDEKEIFDECIKILSGLDDVHIFYYGKYESRVFKRMLKSKTTKKIRDLLMNKSTNILTVVYSNLYFPTYSNSLKDIGKYLGCSWSARNASGIQSIIWRKKWEHSKDSKLKDALIEYNYEDCVALKAVVDFVCEVFNKEDSKRFDNKLQNNIGFVEEIKSDEDEKLLFKLKEYSTKDIEVITKCAYFEYQRNKIFLRTNKNIKKIIQRNPKQTRVMYKPNKIIVFEARKCPYCKSKELFHDEDNHYTKTCFDLRISNYGIKRWITIYQSFSYICLFCKKRFIPKNFMKIYVYNIKSLIPKNYIKRKQLGYGHSLLSWIVYQNVVNRTTFRNLKNTTKDFFELLIKDCRMWDLKIIAAEYYKVTYNKILRKMVQGHLIHADETKVRLRNNIGYVWVLTSMEEVLYIYRSTREAGFLHELLKGFEGVLITDFYSGYDSLKCFQQKCLIHLIRDLNCALLKHPFDDELKEVVTRFGSLVRKIIDTIDRFGLKSRFMRKHKKDVKRFYRWLSKQNFNSELAECFKKRMIKYEKKLFLFLEYNDIPWNNNNAEHAIKYFANYRKTVKGLTTERGLEAHLILFSIYQTCNYKGINFMDFLLSKERDIDKFMRKH